MRAFLAVALLILPVVGSAEIFKCVEKGKTIYTDKPCSGSGGKIEVNSGLIGGSLVDAGVVEAGDGLARDRRLAAIKREVGERQEKIQKLQRLLDLEMAYLDERKRYANNNLAGAIWKSSLSDEQSAKARQYQTQIEAEQHAITNLLAESNDLKSGH